MSGRSRRGRDGAKSALEALRDAKTGKTKRSEQYQVTDETPLYEEVPEQLYNRMQQEDDFVVDNEGYAVNYGEDEEVADDEARKEAEREARRKKAEKKRGALNRAPPPKKPVTEPAAPTGKIASLLAKGAAAPAATLASLRTDFRLDTDFDLDDAVGGGKEKEAKGDATAKSDGGGVADLKKRLMAFDDDDDEQEEEMRRGGGGDNSGSGVAAAAAAAAAVSAAAGESKPSIEDDDDDEKNGNNDSGQFGKKAAKLAKKKLRTFEDFDVLPPLPPPLPPAPVGTQSSTAADTLTSSSMPQTPPQHAIAAAAAGGEPSAVPLSTSVSGMPQTPPTSSTTTTTQSSKRVKVDTNDRARASSSTSSASTDAPVARAKLPLPAAPRTDFTALSRTDANATSNASSTSSNSAASSSAATVEVKVPITGEGVEFFWFDATEDPYNSPGTVYLFGKVWAPEQRKHVSCTVIVRGLERFLFVAPRARLLDDDGKETAKAVTLDDVENELAQVLHQHGIHKHMMKRVQRNYVWENEAVPFGITTFIKCKYSAKVKALPSTLSGRTFSHIFGTQTSALETLLIKRHIKGPCWLNVIKPILPDTRVSHSKVEFVVETPAAINVFKARDGKEKEPPRFTVLSLNVRTELNEKNQNEVILISGLVNTSTNVDGPTANAEKPEMSFCGLVRLRARPLPTEFERDAREKGFEIHQSERSLLNYFLNKVIAYDPDVLVAHNFYGFDIDVLLHRMQHLKIPNWSRLGALKRSRMPTLSRAGEESTWAARQCVAGRLVCDTYLSARELVREKNYTLSQLAESQLQETRADIQPEQVPDFYETARKLDEFVRHSQHDAWLQLRLMFKLNILPLTKNLSNLAGNLWSHSLQGMRAERIEYLLLHKFRENKLIMPDKGRNSESVLGTDNSTTTAANNNTSGSASASGGGGGGGGGGDHEEEEEGKSTKKKRFSKKHKPAYAGGLVLEPKKGFYDKYILLLDFQSLYPSIIQEHNVCFTTVARPRKNDDGTLEWAEPPSPETAVGLLPRTVRELVDRRREVKKVLKTEKDPSRRQQLDVKQQALKLVANSMYGCLGFSNSRFFAMHLAELITRKGRETLQTAVALVKNNFSLEVIYGDTDSIMINTLLDDIDEVRKLGDRLKEKINKNFHKLEIEVDNIFKSILLLKKKKYAALVVQANGETVKQSKGLDLVRRDWCDLSKDIGNYTLDQILSGKSRDEVIIEIQKHLREVGTQIQSNQVMLSKYIITKSLTKPPEQYPDAKSQPHVQVALKMKREGRNVRSGEHIPYVICIGAEGSSLADRAWPPEAVAKGNGQLQIDTQWYLTTQVIPPIARLCDALEGMDSSRIAECLGVDPAKYIRARPRSEADGSAAGGSAAESSRDDAERFKNVEKLTVVCHNCKISEELGSPIRDGRLLPLACSSCQTPYAADYLANLLRLAFHRHAKRYYTYELKCVEDQCKTRVLYYTKEARCVVPEHSSFAAAHLEHTEGEIYTQLLYYATLFDVPRALARMDEKEAKLVQFPLLARKPYDEMLVAARRLLDMDAHAIVQTSSIFAQCFRAPGTAAAAAGASKRSAPRNVLE